MLTVPTVQEFEAYLNTDFDDADEPYAELCLQQAADLLFFSTGATEDPEDPAAQRVVSYAIMDVAAAIMFSNESKAARYAGYVSESIGSYNYSVSSPQGASDAAKEISMWFPIAVGILTASEPDESWTVTSQDLFGWDPSIVTVGPKPSFGQITGKMPTPLNGLVRML